MTSTAELNAFLTQLKLESDVVDPERQVDIVVRKTALVGLRHMIFNTRVDTGRARGNYHLSFGAVGTEEFPEDKAGGATFARAVSAMQGKKLAGTITHLNNNVPYIQPLEDLDQMIEEAVAAMQAQFEQ